HYGINRQPLMTFEPHLLRDDADRAECVAEVARLQSGRERDAHAPRIALLKKIITLYDDDFLRGQTPDPIDAIVFRMQQLGLRQADVARWLGGRNRASEVLARKRP